MAAVRGLDQNFRTQFDRRYKSYEALSGQSKLDSARMLREFLKPFPLDDVKAFVRSYDPALADKLERDTTLFAEGPAAAAAIGIASTSAAAAQSTMQPATSDAVRQKQQSSAAKTIENHQRRVDAAGQSVTPKVDPKPHPDKAKDKAHDPQDPAKQARELLAGLGHAANYDKKLELLHDARALAQKLPDGSKKKALLSTINKAEAALPETQLAFESLQNADVQKVMTFVISGQMDGLTANQLEVVKAAVFGPEASARGAELIAALEPARRKKVQGFRAGLEAGMAGYPDDVRHAMQTLLKAKPDGRAAAANALVDAYRGHFRGSIGTAGNLSSMMKTIDGLPTAYQGPAREFVQGRDKLDRKIEANCALLSSMINSSMSIETLIIMFMAIFQETKEEGVKQKMREIAFAQAKERFDNNVLTDKKQLVNKQASKEPLSLEEQAHLAEIEKAEKFNTAELGIDLRPSDLLMQDLQMLMQQLNQTTQALAGVLRMIQDLAQTIIRNIR